MPAELVPSVAQPQEPTKLRTYQDQSICSAWDYLTAGGTRGLLVLPTGAGKSLILASLAQRAADREGRIIVLAHVGELIGQNAAACARLAGEDRVGIFAASQRRRDADRPIVVASIQTIAKRAAALGPIDLAIIDEAHLVNPAGEGLYRRLIADIEQLAGRPLPLIGLTATPWRLTSGRLDQPWHERPSARDRRYLDVLEIDHVGAGRAVA